MLEGERTADDEGDTMADGSLPSGCNFVLSSVTSYMADSYIGLENWSLGLNSPKCKSPGDEIP